MKKIVINVLIIILSAIMGSLITFYCCTTQQQLKIGKKIGYNITKELGYDEVETTFNSWNEKKEKMKLSKFLEKNNLVVFPGEYWISQAAKFEDVLFILQIGIPNNFVE